MRRSLKLLAAVSLAACAARTPSPAPAGPAAAPAARTPAPAGDPASLSYGPGTGRYRLESTFHNVTEIMGNSQVADGATTLVVSAAATAQADNLALSFTVDSAISTGVAGPGGSPADLSALVGKTFQVVATGRGKAVSLVVPDTSNPTIVQTGENFRDFLPALPPSPISAGQTWTDTATNTTRAPGTTVTSVTVRNHRVVGWETRDGRRVLHISTSSAYTLTGETESAGQAVRLNGTGRGAVERFISSNGVFLLQTATDSASIMANVVAMNLEVPVRQVRQATVTRLP